MLDSVLFKTKKNIPRLKLKIQTQRLLYLIPAEPNDQPWWWALSTALVWCNTTFSFFPRPVFLKIFVNATSLLSLSGKGLRYPYSESMSPKQAATKKDAKL